MTKIEERIILAAMSQIGAPYIWGGKGFIIWPGKTHEFGRPVFDCSGLVTYAFNEAELGDVRLTHSAQTLWNRLKPLAGGTLFLEMRPALAFYGRDKTKITHVAFVMNIYGQGLVLEASGGNQDTHAITAGAKVRIGEQSRTDLIGCRMLPEKPSDLV